METLTWRGPKPLWDEGPSKCVLQDQFAQSPGIYLWTVPVEGVYFVNYVGMTSISIADRLRGHLESWLTGRYWIYDPDALAKGEKVRLYEPPKPPLGVDRFLANYERLASKLYEFLKVISVIYLPSEEGALMLKRIESGLISKLQKSGETAKKFLDNHQVSLIVPDGDRISMKVRFPVPVFGLDEDLCA